MALPGNQPRCEVCTDKLVKNGTTSAGRTRWRCRRCGASKTQQRIDITARAEIRSFHRWVLSSDPQHQFGLTDRGFRKRIDWCWGIEVPQPDPTGVVHRQIIVDGTYFQGWCVLIAHDGTHVLSWQWCATENKPAWATLLGQLPRPDVIVTDGGTGLRAALEQRWRGTRIQRCYFHIYAAVRRHITQAPKLEANQQILTLTKRLMKVGDLDAAAAWMGDYASWEARWAQFLAERTYARPGIERPGWVKPHQRWWYTHLRSRRVRGLYRQLISDESLFTWLEPDYLDSQGIPVVARTTSALEGGPNRAVKDLLRAHRGMPEAHARRAVDWLLNSLTEDPHDPWDPARGHLQRLTAPQPPPQIEEPIGPALYDTGTTAEEGLWARSGWVRNR